MFKRPIKNFLWFFFQNNGILVVLFLGFPLKILCSFDHHSFKFLLMVIGQPKILCPYSKKIIELLLILPNPVLFRYNPPLFLWMFGFMLIWRIKYEVFTASSFNYFLWFVIVREHQQMRFFHGDIYNMIYILCNILLYIIYTLYDI